MIEIDIINTKDEIIRKHARTIVNLTDLAEFWEALADKMRKQLELAIDFIQKIIDQWEIDTPIAQAEAIETIEKIRNIKLKRKDTK